MSRTISAGSYRAVLALPYARPTFAAALVGRLAYGLLPLSLLFTVQSATDSFAIAGAAVAIVGATSILLPFKSRIVDRRGQHRVLPALATACSATLITTAVLAATGAGATSAYVGLAGLLGIAAPPLGPAMRSTWRVLTDGTGLKERAYSLDSVCEESLYLVGPMVVGVLLAVASAPIALAATGALMAIGTFAMVWSPPARQQRGAVPADAAGASAPIALAATGALMAIGTFAMVWSPPARQQRGAVPADAAGFGIGPLRAPGFPPIVATILTIAAALSLTYTCIAARAQDHGAPQAAGYIEAAIACGSVTGGLLWGRRAHRHGRLTELVGLTAYLAVGLAIAAATPGLVALGVVLAATGLAIAPAFVVAYLAADDLAPAHQRTEASTWVNTANNIGAAVGASGAGVLIETADTTYGFVTAGGVLAASATVIWLRSRR